MSPHKSNDRLLQYPGSSYTVSSSVFLLDEKSGHLNKTPLTHLWVKQRVV